MSSISSTNARSLTSFETLLLGLCSRRVSKARVVMKVEEVGGVTWDVSIIRPSLANIQIDYGVQYNIGRLGL